MQSMSLQLSSTAPANAFRERQQMVRERYRQQVNPGEDFDWLAVGETVPGRFAKMVCRFPERVAVYDQSEQLSYRELNEMSNRFANGLLAQSEQTPGVVALFVSQDVMALVAALGVLKAGKAYVGFDDAFSEKLYRHILDDVELDDVELGDIEFDDVANVMFVSDVAHMDLARRLAGEEKPIFSVETVGQFSAEQASTIPLPEAIAVLNYSSGSTGAPKGVVQTHHSVLAQAAGFASLCSLGDGDRVTTFGALAWAGTFWTLFGPLCYGACVAIFPTRQSHISQLIDWLEQTRVTVLTGMTTTIRLIAESANGRQLPAVRLVHIGGDTNYRRDVEIYRHIFPTALISAGLGTTEAGRMAEWLIDQDEAIDWEVVPLGLPTPAMTIRLLDEKGDEVVTGEPGEIAVQSSYLAQGYWNQPALTAAKFRIDPRFGSQRLYLTGDMGRFEANGLLRHLGRKDFQVKVNGYRVHVNEIEAMLLALPGIAEASLVLQGTEAQQEVLVAYLVLAPQASWTSDELRRQLSTNLPAYMTPQRFVFLPELPKTPNQKVDRSRLPALDSFRPDLSTPFVPPLSPLEKHVASIWQDILAIQPVGIRDDFLTLGGDSVSASRIVNRVLAELSVQITAAELLSAGTISAMASMLLTSMLADTCNNDRLQALPPTA